MDCPSCGTAPVVFAVPPDLREHAPEGANRAALCPDCLALSPASDAEPTGEFSRIVDDFPDGEAGPPMALAVGLLVDSLALNREAVIVLFERVADAGADPWLVLERLAAAGGVDPDADLGRLRRQLDQLL